MRWTGLRIYHILAAGAARLPLGGAHWLYQILSGNPTQGVGCTSVDQQDSTQRLLLCIGRTGIDQQD